MSNAHGKNGLQLLPSTVQLLASISQRRFWWDSANVCLRWFFQTLKYLSKDKTSAFGWLLAGVKI